MITENYKGSASGQISIYSIVNNKMEKILTRKNTILSNANYLLSRLLMQDPNAQVNRIRVYHGASLLATGIITGFLYIDPNEVEFSAVFNDASFNGQFTKVALGPTDLTTMGGFSEVSGIDITKANNETISIYWNIKFNS